MKPGRISHQQMVWILRATDQDSVTVVVKRIGTSEATIYIRRKKSGQLDTDQVKRLKAMEAENVRLHEMLVNPDLETGHEGNQRKKGWCTRGAIPYVAGGAPYQTSPR